MTSFLITFIPTFVLLAGAGLLVNYCKSRPSSGKHQLTGICHRSGGTSCCSCNKNMKQ